MKRIILIGVICLLGLATILGSTYLPITHSPIDYLTQQAGNEKSEKDIKISFSHNENFYSETITVSFTADDMDTEIYYTMDGSPPTEKSTRFTAPIEIKAKRTVEATTFKIIAKKGDVISPVVTKSYVVGQGITERFTEDTLVFVLSTDPYNLYDYDFGIAVKGAIYDEWLKNEYKGGEIPFNAPGNYYQNGREAERDMFVEVFTNDGTQVIKQAAGARVVGGYSRAVDQKSFRLIARKTYDPENGKFKYPFFKDAVDNNGMMIDEFDRIVLRNNANDREFASVRDELSQELARQSGFPTIQNTRPAAVFLNGKYYGFSWLHENFNEDYLATQFGGIKDNYEIVQNNENDDQGSERAVADFKKLQELYDADLTDDKKFEEFKSLVDIDNLIMYYAMQIYIDNRDWPMNNYKAYKYYPSEGEENLTEFQDGKFRYLFFDAEFAWSLYGNPASTKTLENLLKGRHGGHSKSDVLIAILKRDDMKEKLSNQINDLISTTFSPENVKKVLEQKMAEGDKEIFYALQNGYTSTWASKASFDESRQQIRIFADKRPEIMRNDMAKQFNLSKDLYTIEVTGASGATTYLNTIAGLDGKTMTAQYFVEHAVEIKAEIHDGFAFDYWEVNGNKVTDESIKVSVKDVVSDKVSVKLHTKTIDTDLNLQISEVYTAGSADWVAVYNPNSYAITTENLYLSDDENDLTRFKIPTMTIKPFEELIIVCKNNKDSSALLKVQANFNLKAGEVVTLSDGDGKVIEQLKIPTLDANQSYKRATNGRYYANTLTQ